MTIESPKVTVNKSAKETFDFLTNVKNFEVLMPESIDKFEVLGENKFLFALKGMPEITLERKNEIKPNKIVMGSANGKIDFSLVADIAKVSDDTSQVQLFFEGDFNPMMAMMIKKPIKNFIQTLAENMTRSV